MVSDRVIPPTFDQTTNKVQATSLWNKKNRAHLSVRTTKNSLILHDATAFYMVILQLQLVTKHFHFSILDSLPVFQALTQPSHL